MKRKRRKRRQLYLQRIRDGFAGVGGLEDVEVMIDKIVELGLGKLCLHELLFRSGSGIRWHWVVGQHLAKLVEALHSKLGIKVSRDGNNAEIVPYAWNASRFLNVLECDLVDAARFPDRRQEWLQGVRSGRRSIACV